VSRSRRIRVGVLAGGASSERPISLATGIEIAESLPADRYEVVLIDPLALMARNPALTDEQRRTAVALAEHAGRMEALPERDRRALPAPLQAKIERAAAALVPATNALVPAAHDRAIDVAFVAIHGRWGEDGTIQGLLDLLGVPYVGSDVLASALAIDKAMAKKILIAAGIEVPAGVVVGKADWARATDAALAEVSAVGLPAVVKPVREGSSFGITMVSRASDMAAAISAGLAYDDRVLVEQRLFGTELTVGIVELDDDGPTALPVIEIVTGHDYFDYSAKYDPALTEEVCPARIPDQLRDRAQELARRAHRAIGCRDLSRVDMIATADGRLVVLEVNTIPGMTANSLLPKAAAVAGMPFGDLCARLIERALARRQ
jgi:D-alanine-D-alanine ligase